MKSKKKSLWSVHLDRENHPDYENENRYSITLNESFGGWNTDSGHEGYGLPKELAEWICKTLNQCPENCPYEMKLRNWEKKK